MQLLLSKITCQSTMERLIVGENTIILKMLVSLLHTLLVGGEAKDMLPHASLTGRTYRFCCVLIHLPTSLRFIPGDVSILTGSIQRKRYPVPVFDQFLLSSQQTDFEGNQRMHKLFSQKSSALTESLWKTEFLNVSVFPPLASYPDRSSHAFFDPLF